MRQMVSRAPAHAPEIAQTIGVFTLGGLLFAFCASLFILPGQDSITYLIRTLQCWLVGFSCSAVWAAFLSRPIRLIWLSVASACVLLLALLSTPGLTELRLGLMNGLMPTSAPQGPTRSACLCATRGVILELFGRPDFATDAIMIGERYAYLLDGDGDLVIYVFEEPGAGGDDPLIAVERARLTSEEIAARRLLPVPLLRP
jgi:hypothetical protein